MDSLNRLATELVDEAIDFAEELTIDVYTLSGDTTVLDFGVEIPGGLEAGLLLSEIQTAGLATVQSTMDEIGDVPLTHVEVSTDQPALALLCGSKAGWEVSIDEFEGLGSGPARALVAEEDIFQRIAYQDSFDLAVLALESEMLPDEAVAEHIAERAGVPESGVLLPTYSSSSITGSVVGASRAGELAVYRLLELGYDPLNILSVTGKAPVAPVAESEAKAMARTNDAIAYGGQVHLIVDEPFEDFDGVASSAHEEYGKPFESIFESVGWDFSEVPRSTFGPAQVTIDVLGDDTETYGSISADTLARSYEF